MVVEDFNWERWCRCILLMPYICFYLYFCPTAVFGLLCVLRCQKVVSKMLGKRLTTKMLSNVFTTCNQASEIKWPQEHSVFSLNLILHKQNPFWLRMSRNIALSSVISHSEGIYITQVSDSCSSLWTVPIQCCSAFSCCFQRASRVFWLASQTVLFQSTDFDPHWRQRHMN